MFTGSFDTPLNSAAAYGLTALTAEYQQTFTSRKQERQQEKRVTCITNLM